MRKIGLQWIEGDIIYKTVQLPLKTSRYGNLYVEHNGRVYVFQDMKHGRLVVTKNGSDKWQLAGRISHILVFLGSDTEPSWPDLMNQQRTVVF